MTTAPLRSLLKKTACAATGQALGGYFARLERQGISVNVASYVGSGQVRLDVMGNINRAPTAEELDKMEGLVTQSMREGAIGLSSGLIFAPNMFAKTEELIDLARRTSGKFGGLYTTHVRGEGRNALPAIGEAIEVAEKAGVPCHILHLKSNGRANWGRMGEIIKLFRRRATRRRYYREQYPYIAGMTSLEQCLPPKYLRARPTR